MSIVGLELGWSSDLKRGRCVAGCMDSSRFFCNRRKRPGFRDTLSEI